MNNKTPNLSGLFFIKIKRLHCGIDKVQFFRMRNANFLYNLIFPLRLITCRKTIIFARIARFQLIIIKLFVVSIKSLPLLRICFWRKTHLSLVLDFVCFVKLNDVFSELQRQILQFSWRFNSDRTGPVMNISSGLPVYQKGLNLQVNWVGD